MDYRRMIEDVALVKTLVNTESIATRLAELTRAQGEAQEFERREAVENMINSTKSAIETVEKRIDHALESLASIDSTPELLRLTQSFCWDAVHGAVLATYEAQYSIVTHALIEASRKTLGMNTMLYDSTIAFAVNNQMKIIGGSQTFAAIGPGGLLDTVLRVFNKVIQNKFCTEYLNKNPINAAVFMIVVKSVLIKLMFYQYAESSKGGGNSEYLKTLDDSITACATNIRDLHESIKSASLEEYLQEETFLKRQLTRYHESVVIAKSFRHADREELITIKTASIDRPLSMSYALAFQQAKSHANKKQWFELLVSFLRSLKYNTYAIEKWESYEQYEQGNREGRDISIAWERQDRVIMIVLVVLAVLAVLIVKIM